MIARFTRDVEIRSPQVRELHDVGTVGDLGSLRLRVHGTNVDAYVPTVFRGTSPPRFSGQVSADGTGTVVRGRIRESLNSATWTRVDAAVIVIMLAILTLGIVGLTTGYSGGGLPPLIIGVVGVPVFAWRWRTHRDRRIREWVQQSANLADELTAYVRGG